MADSLFLLDLKGNILDINKSAKKLMGFSREEMLGHSAEVIFGYKGFYSDNKSSVHFGIIWTLLLIEIWNREFIDNAIEEEKDLCQTVIAKV